MVFFEIPQMANVAVIKCIWLGNKLYEKADKGSDPQYVDLITKGINEETSSKPQRIAHFIRLEKENVFNEAFN
jgi:hypothetical protein